MASIADIWLALRGDGKQLVVDAKKEGEKAGAVAGKSFGGSMKGSLSKTFGSAKGGILAGLGIGAGFGAFQLAEKGIGMVTDAIFASIDAASDLNEAVSKSEAVFGSSADEMEDWAETASDSFGQSKRQALEAAGTFGNLIQAFGIGADKAGDMSKSLVELASDLASFNNTSVDEAITALRSGLSGETEPLKRYGVALSDVRLKEEALRMGLIKTTKGVLPLTIKTQAAYALILKDTVRAQGDFDRTSDGLANTQKSLQAQLEDVSAELGEALLPIMLDFANILKDDVLPAISDLTSALTGANKAADNSDIWGNLQNILHDLFKDPSEDARTFLGEVFDGFNSLIGYTDEYYAAQKAMALEAGRETNRGMNQMKASLAGGEEALDDLGGAAGETAEEVDESMDTIAEVTEAARDRIVDAALDIVNNAFDILDNRAELSAINHEKAELRKVIATGNATKEQKEDYADLTERQAELVLELGRDGVTATNEVETAVEQMQGDLKTANSQTKRALVATMNAWNELRRTMSRPIRGSIIVSGGSVGGKLVGDPRRATGGQVAKGSQYLWSEPRQPELFIPGASGRIAAAPEIRAAMAERDGPLRDGGMTVQMEVYGSPPVVESPLAIAREMQRATDLMAPARFYQPPKWKR